MLIDEIRITYTGFMPRPGDLTQRQWNDARRRGWQEVGEFWHAVLRPKHFTREGGREYRYTPRSGETGRSGGKKFWRTYAGQKQKRYGHQDPLVLTGELRDRAKVARIVPYAAGSRSGVRVILPGAQKANFKNPHGGIDMRDELTRVSEQEERQLSVVLDDGMGRALADIRHREVKTL